MDERYKATNRTIYDFYNKIYIRCPRCGLKAEIRKKDKNNCDLFSIEILYCDSCGYIKEGKMLFNCMNLELWLQIQCCGKNLWALNENHLDYIENYIRAKLRERERRY